MVAESARRPRVLVIATRLPAPVVGGADLRVRQTLSALATCADVGVVGLRPGLPSTAPAGVLLWRDATGASRGPLPAAPAASWLGRPGAMPSDMAWTEAAAAAVEGAFDELEPDLAIVHHLDARCAFPTARARCERVVYASHNVEGLLRADLAAADEGESSDAPWIAARSRGAEAALVAGVDEVWACSELDARLFAQTYERCAPVRVVPNGADATGATARQPERPPLLVLPALLTYPPNVRGVHWLVRRVVPALRRQVPGTRLAVLGLGAPPALERTARRARGVELAGWVEATGPWLARASAVPIPLFEGGGTRQKAVEAFAAGVPVVSTTKGVEGLEAEPGRHYLRADDAEAFVAALARVCTDAELAASLAAEARALVRERYSPAVIAERVQAAVRELTGAPLPQAMPRPASTRSTSA